MKTSLTKKLNNNFLVNTNYITMAIISPHESVDDWERFNDMSLPRREDFHSHLNMKNIIDADYVHPQNVCKYFEIKHLWEYYDLYVQSNTLL